MLFTAVKVNTVWGVTLGLGAVSCNVQGRRWGHQVCHAPAGLHGDTSWKTDMNVEDKSEYYI